jgi:hypothetical protein
VDQVGGELGGGRTRAAKAATLALRAAPWVVFGPISGFCCERAYRVARQGHPILAVLYIAANFSILSLLPMLTYFVTQLRPH